MSRTSYAYASFAAALVIILAVTIVQGNWSERWGDHPELKIFAERVREVPLEIGEWHGKKTAEPSKRIRQAAGAVAMLSADYLNSTTNQSVRVHVVCGRLQDVFYHTPDRCYPASGFEAQGDPVRQTFDLHGTKAEFFTSVFQRSEASGSVNLRIYWSWCADGPWVAPDQEKWTFAGRRALYKLYVETNAATDSTADNNAAVDFIKVLIPELQKTFKPAIDTVKGANKQIAAAKT